MTLELYLQIVATLSQQLSWLNMQDTGLKI